MCNCNIKIHIVRYRQRARGPKRASRIICEQRSSVANMLGRIINVVQPPIEIDEGTRRAGRLYLCRERRLSHGCYQCAQ